MTTDTSATDTCATVTATDTTVLTESFGWIGCNGVEAFVSVVEPQTVGPTARPAVVIVGPYGIEALAADRTLRALGCRLARSGSTVLHVEAPDVGDGSGDQRQMDRLARWVTSVTQAVEEAARRGDERVILIGVRLGAIPATLAAADARTSGRVAGLALWAPVVRGRLYVRELKLASSSGSNPTAQADNGDLGAGGFVMPASMATELAAIDLGTLPAPAARVLVIDRDDVSSAGGLITVWAGHGIEFTSLDVPGYARAQLDDPERGDVAHDVNAEIADWCDTFDAAPGTGSGGLPAAGTGGGSLDVGMSTDGSLAPGAGTPSEAPTAIREHVSITGDPCGRTVEESVVRLGVNGDLLGIVTHPATDTEVARGTLSGSRYVARTLNVPRAPERTASALATTAVLILTTGSNVRSGPGRLATTLARRWASLGLTVVRYDRRGIGGSGVDVDSGNGRGWMVGDAYGELNIEDAADVLRWMRAQGHERVVLVGMCSGAWLGYRTLAHELPPDASMPVGLVAINQVMWDDINWGGDGESPALAAKAGRELKKGIASPDRWKDLARGEIPVWTNIARLFRLATMLVRQRFCSEVNALSEQLGVIEKRGVWQIQVFDAEELGPAYLQMRGESAIERLCNAGLLTRLDTAGAGHTFAPGASKKWLMERLDAELQRRGVFADVSHGS